MLLEMKVKTERTDRGHGSPYDRGTADSWYSRTPKPHYFEGDTYYSPKVEEKDMSKKQISEYWAGYDDNENDPSMRKDWE